MSVAITFETEDHSGLVAEGTSLWDAARRMGVHLRADCNGRGECDACAVEIVAGAELLSPETNAEEKILGATGPSRAMRLACQTRLEGSGEVVVRLAPIAPAAKNKYQKRLRDLPFHQQLSSLIEIEAIAMTEAVNTVRGKYLSFVERLLNLTPPKEASQVEVEAIANDDAKASVKKE